MLSFIMLMVTNNPFMLSVVRLNVILLSVTMLNVANNPFMLSVVMLNVVMLSVVCRYFKCCYAERHYSLCRWAECRGTQNASLK